MPILGFAQPKQQEGLTSETAYTFWRVLTDTYSILNHFNILINFAHDRKMATKLSQFLDEYREEGKRLEALLGKYGLPGPRPHSVDQSATGNSEVVKDADIVETLFVFIKLDLIELVLALRNVYVNKDAENQLIRLIKSAISRSDRFIKWGKTNGWLTHPPLYPSVQAETTDRIAANEVFMLWDSLVFKYRFARLARFLGAFVTDDDFKKHLIELISHLEKQASRLEKKMLHFGITLPNPYTPIVSSVERNEMLDDSFILSTLLRSYQDSAIFHVGGISDLIVNDDVRRLLINIANDDIDEIGALGHNGEFRDRTRRRDNQHPLYLYTTRYSTANQSIQRFISEQRHKGISDQVDKKQLQ